MSRIRIIVADDEPLARNYLKSLIESEADCELIRMCPDARSTVEAVQNESPDLVFLDVQMPGKDGFSVIEDIGSEEIPHVVFVTAHDRYAVPAFEKHAIDYLLKPFSRERFQEALTRVRHRLTLQKDAAWSRTLRDMLQTVLKAGSGINTADAGRGEAHDPVRARIDRIPIRIGPRVRLIKCSDIDWIGAADCYVNLHCGRETFLHRESMTALESALDPNRFLRIHRSSIVNIDAISEIRAESSGDHQVILKDGTALILSRRRRKDLARLLGREI